MNARLIRPLIPSVLGLLIYLVSSLSALFVATSRNWADQWLAAGLSENVTDMVSSRFNELWALVRGVPLGGYSATAATLGFWLIVGALVYMLVWLIYAVIHGILNEIELSLIFVHPRSFKESTHWGAFLSRILLRVAAVIVAIGYSALFVNVIWPAVVVQFAYGLLTWTPMALIVHSVGAVLTLVLSLHLLLLLLRVVLLRKTQS